MTEQGLSDGPGEVPVYEETQAPAAGFPPYPPYATEPAPPSVADTIIAGRDLRIQHKSTPRKSVRLPPRPAKPKGPKATDVKLSKRAARAHARCLRRYGAALTDRLEYISKPPRRSIIYLWREHAHTLPAETIARLRSMLDADEPFKPDQAYEYFINLRKNKKKIAAARGINQIKKGVLALSGDKRIVWARNATVAFARGIQQRLSRPGSYVLADGMLRLSNIILEDLCGYMHMRMPSRRCTYPKAKFMMEMSDKVAVWIDEILAESDDRMLMMDFDEDNEVEKSIPNTSEADDAKSSDISGTPSTTPKTSKTNITGADELRDAAFTDNFLNMMGDASDGLLKGPQPAYLKFIGEMLEAFTILTDSMYKKEDEQILSYGKFNQTYTEAANELKETPDFNATEFNTTLASQLKSDLTVVAKPYTPSNIAPYMKEMVEICSNYLAQHAEFNKDKGPSFKILIKAMRAKGNEQLYQKGKAKRTYTKAATELESARGLESDHDDPNLSQEIHSRLSKLTETQTPADLKTDMKETLDLCSKYLSQRAIDEIERGPAFDILIKELEKQGADSFTPQFRCVETNFAAAYVLKSAPGLSGVVPDDSKTQIFVAALHKVVDTVTPKPLAKDMHEVIGRCANYLSAFVRDRDKALQSLLKMMKSNPNVELAKRNKYAMNNAAAVAEIEAAPIIVPYMPVKDIADEVKTKLTKDMEGKTSPDMQIPVKALIQDVSRYLSQPIAIRSGVAGERYPINFLAAVKKSLGSRPLFKYKAFGQTYADAAEELKFAGPLESDPKCENLQFEISSEMKRGVPTRLAPTITNNLNDTMDDASKHLAKVGSEKGEALQHLVNLMKEQGETPLGQIQGYQQSYVDGARRIENAPSLTNDKVDKGVYESVRGKLTSLSEKKPAPEFTKQMPAIVDDSSKFLAAPFPESEAEKRRVLADLLARKENEILGKEGIYKLTYTEGGEEIMKAPVGVIKAKDENAKKQLLEKVNAVIPEKKLQDVLKVPVNEGATYLSEIIKGRGEAMQVIHDEMKKEKDKDFISVGTFSKTHEEAAKMLEMAPHFSGQHPSPVLVDKVAEQVEKLSTSSVTDKAKPYIPDASSITTQYIAGVATKECGLDAKGLAALEKSNVGGVDVPKTGVLKINEDRGAPPRGPQVSISQVPKASITDVPGTSSRAARPSSLGENAFKKQMEEEERRKREEAERRRRLEAEKHGRVFEDIVDPEREQALQILHRQLRARGAEVFYKQPHTELTHAKASQWLSEPSIKVDKSVKECSDTARLHKKFERKLSQVVSASTPVHMYDTMQDVIIESSRILSEYFVSKSFKVLVRLALISEMQKRGNEILIEVDGATETFFFAAQRLKKAISLEVDQPCSEVSYRLSKKLEDIIKCRSMPRKLTSSIKDHIKDAADYLSAHVTKPDEQIEAYVALLSEMETAGDSLLIEGNIPKTFKEAATYLRQLTTFENLISLPNSSLQSSIEGKLKNIMANVSTSGYTKSAMDDVIRQSTKLLVSHIMLQGIKTEALNILIEQMDIEGGNVLLRHGNLRRTFGDGADALRSKNSDQLSVPSADPVVARKIQIKLRNLMQSCTPDKYSSLMDDVIEDATMYLAVHFLQPHVIQVCKCMKNVFVQCELWCDEILRRVAKPCCNCSRHISLQALADLGPGTSQAYTHGLEISITPCPSKQNKIFSNQGEKPYVQPCPVKKPSDQCKRTTTSYLLYSSEYQKKVPLQTTSLTHGLTIKSPMCSPKQLDIFEEIKTDNNVQFVKKQDISPDLPIERDRKQEIDTSSGSFQTPKSDSSEPANPAEHAFWQSPTTMYARVQLRNKQTAEPEPEHNISLSTKTWDTNLPRRLTSAKRGYNTRAPIITTDQMSDWHAMMVSLTWNVQAWRGWIQENIDRALDYQSKGETEETWASFQRQTSTEALQWRQYNNFSRQLTYRLALRYRDKKIVSPTRATLKTDIYMKCQQEMLDIIDMFHRWTRWLSVVIKETGTIVQEAGTDTSINSPRWRLFKRKVEEYLEDWKRYNMHLKVCWEQKYKMLITDWLPELSQSGAVWVVSACGAVPSGAVAAGVYEGEIIWVARTTHRSNILPAALHPSKHCCIVYSDGGIYHYTKYQVMCNAEVSWVACRATETRAGVGAGGGAAGARAVRAARDVLVGRVLYRGAHLVGAVHAPAYHCHVVIFGRPFAFSCYELLVLSSDR